MPKKKLINDQESIKIPPIEVKLAAITIVGDSPLLVNKFSEKSKTELDEKQQGRGKTKKGARNPMAEFEAASYKMSDGRYGVPASGIKNCAVSACRFVDGMPMTLAVGAFHVLEQENGLVEIQSINGKKKIKPNVDERIVRVGNFGNKKPMTRYRPIFNDWKITFKVRYNSKVITPEQLLNLYENAGFSIGLCEYRPEKRGNLGSFHVQRH